MKAIVTIFTMMFAIAAVGQNTFTYETATAQVTLLSEGQRDGGLNILIGATPQMIAQVAPDNTYPSATNAFLIRTKSGKNVLIDVAFGRELFTSGLQSTGVAPESIDAILITHLHGDHIGGLLRDGKPAFPNAKLMMSKREAQSANENVRNIIGQYELITFEPGDDAPTPVFDDIKAMSNYGHTPGHTVYFIDNVAIWGDMTHAMAFQMPYPQVAVTYDTDATAAVAARLKMLEYLVANDYIVGGMHIAYPGLGTLQLDDKGGYLFTPLGEQ
ncbi:MAG: MBL fold metallo-hydrolase [Bacteroidales bacterium]|nr:MBL fold metallo-hydrolase [Bacteroidales bacterium]